MSKAYAVLDADGNVEKTILAPEGGSLRTSLDAGGDVYKTNKEGDEIYTPTSEAKVETDIDPVKGTITVKGPKWLTSEVVASDSFKKNYSQNKGLLSLVNMYRSDPTSTITDPTTGEPIKVSDAIRTYQDSLSSYGADFALIREYKNNISKKYGVNFSDEEVAIANTFYNKDDYNKSGAVYVPEWAKNMYNWSSLGSWDEKNGTVSADDFFSTVYAQDFDNNTAKKLQDEAISRMTGFVDFGVYDPGDEENAKIHQDILSDKSYAAELARTIQMYNLVSQNKPETSALYDMAVFSSQMFTNMFKSALEAGYNVSATVVQIFEGFADWTLDNIGVADDDPARDGLGAAFIFANPVYLAAYITGETMNIMRDGGDINKIVADLEADTKAMWRGQLGDRYDEYNKEVDALFTEFNEKMANLTGAAAAGEMFGNLAWKIAENIILLNTVGGAIGAKVSALGTSSGVATFLGKTMSPKTVATIFKTIGFAANVTAQGFMETFIDDKELVNKAFASGEMTPELTEKIQSNIWWNAIGEGATKGMNWVLTQTTAGRVATMSAAKVTQGTQYVKGTILEKVFTKLNGIKVGGKNIVEVASGAGEAAGKSVEAFNTAMGYHGVNGLRRLLLQNPIISEASESFNDMVNRIIKVIYPGKVELSPEEMAEITKEVGEAVDSMADGGDVVAKETISEEGSAAAKTAAKQSLSERVAANWERYQKIVSARVNLENQIDAISKGVSMKMSEMNNVINTDGTVENYMKSETHLAEVESKLKLEGADLTIRESGSLLSKEASEALSLKSQIPHYQWKLKHADALGLKGGDISTIEKFVKAAQEKLGAYSAKYGAAWSQAIDDLLPKMGRYNMKITDYLINNGYVDKEYVKTITKLRMQGYGADGSLYIPTARLFGEDSLETGVNKFLDENFSDKVALFRTRKTIGDDPFFLKPGDIDTSFVDPTMVLYSKFRAAATVAQAQDLGRAVVSANIPIRAVKGYSTDAISDYEVTLIQKGLNGLKNEFYSVFDANGKAFKQIITDAFNDTDIMKSAFDQKKAYEKVDAARKNTERAQKAYNKAVKKETNAGVQDSILKGSTNDELSTVLATPPKNVEVPSFDVRNLNASTFQAWHDGLPDYLKDYISGKLKGQALNVTNVKKIATSDNIRDMKALFITKNRKAFLQTKEYNSFILAKRSAELNAAKLTTLSKPFNDFQEALAKQAKIESEYANMPKWDAKKIDTLGKEFSDTVDKITEDVIDEITSRLRGTKAFDDTVNAIVEKGAGSVEKEVAERYVVLHQLNKIGKGKFTYPLTDQINGTKSAAFSAARKSGGVHQARAYSDKLAQSVGNGIDKRIESLYGALSGKYASTGAIDMDDYWKMVNKEMDAIEAKGLKSPGEGQRFIQYNRRQIVQIVGEDGTLKYYETDPMLAFAANNQINFYTAGTSDAISNAFFKFNSRLSQVFRWGTTGIDFASYVNQWFRDSFDAVNMGGALPFTNLRTGGVKSFGASIAEDSIPFGQKVFGKAVTDTLTDDFVEATFESTQKGLIDQYGQEWWDAFAAQATKDASPEFAEQILKRKTVEFAADSLGMSAVPGMGGITEAQFYRSGGYEATTMKEVRREQMDIAMAGKGREGLGMTDAEANAFKQMQGKMQEKIDDFFENTSRGQWRESFARRNVYAAQYKNALEAGMTLQEAQAWATRYALDATTDFGRTFAYANRFIKSVPYLGAAINGHKSFIRLLEIDPMGVATRFTYGLVMPYTALLAESLSDPKNLEVYKTIREYEKQDSAFLVYRGAKIQIPMPQQLGRFLAPFRHVVEKAADAQDASWLDLISSDFLGIAPLDLSGFVNLDANDLLNQDKDNGIWARISRGVEKAASGLMPPAVKSAYMAMSGRDPYTGREIDTSYVYIDENGEEQIMDNTKSGIAKGLSDLAKSNGWNLNASAANKILQSLFGRSTITVLDNFGSLLSGDIKSFNESIAEQITRPIDGGSDYDEAKSNWQQAINTAYKKRQELEADQGLQKALSIMRDENYSEEQRQGATQTYRNKVDEYSKFVLDIATKMRQQHPEQYTDVRVAQVVSLLTFQTGISFNDTPYSKELQKDSYYDSRNNAIRTLITMGFPTDTVGNSMLGHGYYDKYGEYQFKVYTPYEIQYMQSAKYGTADQLQAMIKKEIDKANISTTDMWSGYYKATSKAARKAYQDKWNKTVVNALYPIISKYGANSVLNDSSTRDMLEDYIFADNPYKKKQYLYNIFGGTL